MVGRGKTTLLLQLVLLEWGWVCRERGKAKKIRHPWTRG